jgi:hypothetical protein
MIRKKRSLAKALANTKEMGMKSRRLAIPPKLPKVNGTRKWWPTLTLRLSMWKPRSLIRKNAKKVLKRLLRQRTFTRATKRRRQVIMPRMQQRLRTRDPHLK